MTARFDPPVIVDHPTGWGPDTAPANFKDIPYQPFSKADRLGRIADWTGNTYQGQDRRYMNKYNAQIGAGGTQYAYYHEEDESSFQLVDTSKPVRPMYGRGRFFRGGARGGRGMTRGRGGAQRWNAATTKAAEPMQVLSKAQKNREREIQRMLSKNAKFRPAYNRPQIKNRECSVTVKNDWVVIEEMEKTQLSKLSLPTVSAPEDLLCCGTMEYYDKTYDRVNVKSEKPLRRIDRIFHTVTTTDDPIIRKLTKSHSEVNVFATDSILATLMCCTRSAYSWDIVVQKFGGKVFLDKRDNTEFDLLTVSETAAEPPQEEGNSLNSPRNLALEATYLNHNYSQQVLKSEAEKYNFPEENPFKEDKNELSDKNEDNQEETNIESVGYRYRKWDLGNNIKLIARCQHDAVAVGTSNEIQFLTIKALNEWDPRYSGGVDWRQKLDVQPGAVLANELKHNACKLAKWTVQALLVGSDIIKFGFITRVKEKDSSKHVIVGSKEWKPQDFAEQMNLNMDNAWGIIRCIIDLIMQQKDGKYLIVKDPNKPILRLYDIPDNTFESEEDSDDNDESSDGEGQE